MVEAVQQPLLQRQPAAAAAPTAGEAQQLQGLLGPQCKSAAFDAALRNLRAISDGCFLHELFLLAASSGAPLAARRSAHAPRGRTIKAASVALNTLPRPGSVPVPLDLQQQLHTSLERSGALALRQVQGQQGGADGSLPTPCSSTPALTGPVDSINVHSYPRGSDCAKVLGPVVEVEGVKLQRVSSTEVQRGRRGYGDDKNLIYSASVDGELAANARPGAQEMGILQCDSCVINTM